MCERERERERDCVQLTCLADVPVLSPYLELSCEHLYMYCMCSGWGEVGVLGYRGIGPRGKEGVGDERKEVVGG